MTFIGAKLHQKNVNLRIVTKIKNCTGEDNSFLLRETFLIQQNTSAFSRVMKRLTVIFLYT